MPLPFSRRSFVIATGAALVVPEVLPAQAKEDEAVIGPLLGHVDANSAWLWARLAKAGSYAVEVALADGSAEAQRQTAEAAVAADLTARWHFSDLKPATKYKYRLVAAEELVGHALEGTFRTAPADDSPASVSLAFGSCALEDEGSRAVWRRMVAEKVDGVVLTGDTPYIDSTDLAKQRERYRAFNRVGEFQALTRSVPHWGTWDDHDFGKNDADGRLPGKENARQAFTEYRMSNVCGDESAKAGIYSSFRYGPVEVFLIDARWFANTGPSPVDKTKPTLLGAAQWDWLQRGLKASTAPWKVLTCGIIWDAKTNGEKDHWETYAHERLAIFDLIRAERISGVVLFGGDIHVTRVLQYDADKTVGYPLYQFISSPMHHKVIPALNNEHPDLKHSALQPNTFMKLTCDTTGPQPRLTARFLDKDGGLLFEEISLTLDEATPRA